jgi:hypothetical protein
MAQLLDRVRTVIRSFGNEGAVDNVQSDIARTAKNREAVDLLEQRLAAVETGWTPLAA